MNVDKMSGKKEGERKRGGKRKIRWRCIALPISLYKQITELAHQNRVARHRVVSALLDSTSTSTSANITQVVQMKEIDRKAWFIFKIANGVADFKARRELEDNSTKQAYEKVVSSLNQVSQKFKVSTTKVMDALEKFDAEPNTDNKVKLNDSVKELIVRILTRVD